MCQSGKPSFISWSQAEKARKRAKRNTKRDINIAPYHCPDCKEYHLGTNNKRYHRS